MTDMLEQCRGTRGKQLIGRQGCLGACSPLTGEPCCLVMLPMS